VAGLLCSIIGLLLFRFQLALLLACESLLLVRLRLHSLLLQLRSAAAGCGPPQSCKCC